MQKLAATAALVSNVACDHGCNSGYAVVDPMPSPARTRLASSITPTVTWADGGAIVILELKDPTRFGLRFTAKSHTGDAGPGFQVSGGRLIAARATTDGMRFEIEPDLARGALFVTIDIDGLDGGEGAVEAAVRWGSTPDGSLALTVSLVDR